MKKLTKESFSGLQNSLPVLSIAELISIVGGNDCVLNCYAYLDPNTSHNSSWYGSTLQQNYSYSVSSMGGVRTSDVVGLGALGGLTVTELTPENTGGQLSLSSSTGTYNGNQVMMTFNNGSGEDHAVVVTGTEIVNGQLRIKYYDPSTGLYDYRSSGSYSAMYSVRSY